jgi:urease accessory protein
MCCYIADVVHGEVALARHLISPGTLYRGRLNWLLGGLIGLTASAENGNVVLSAIGFLLLGGLVAAADLKLSLRTTIARAAVVGLYHGYLNGTGMGQPGAAAIALLGLGGAVFALVALVAAFVAELRAGWARIAVRVAGSWIAASGLLLLGWAARRGP